MITAPRRVTCDVSKGPYSLFPNIKDGRRQEVDKFGDGAGVNDDLSVIGSTGCDVG